MIKLLKKMVSLFCCLAAFVTNFPASGEVHNLHSSLDATNRLHACTGELVTFVCEATGTMLIWTVNENRIIYFSDDRVDTVRVTQGQSTRAILLHNDPSLEGANSVRRFTSVLLFTVDPSTSSINVTCSSDTKTKAIVHKIAVTPGAPTDPKAHVMLHATDSRLNDSMMYLKWNEPLNADRFDLKYYHVRATIPQQIRSSYTWNVTGMELVVRMEMPEISKDMRISVAAVSMCWGTQGQEISFNKEGVIALNKLVDLTDNMVINRRPAAISINPQISNGAEYKGEAVATTVLLVVVESLMM